MTKNQKKIKSEYEKRKKDIHIKKALVKTLSKFPELSKVTQEANLTGKKQFKQNKKRQRKDLKD